MRVDPTGPMVIETILDQGCVEDDDLDEIRYRLVEI